MHSTQLGEDRMFRPICSIWVGPRMPHSGQQYVAQCPQCAKHARGKPAQPPQDLPESMLEVGPMDHLGTDLFHLNGKDYLILLDFFSGFKWVAELRNLDTGEIIKKLEHWFAQGCGLPCTIRCDSGPQFRSLHQLIIPSRTVWPKRRSRTSNIFSKSNKESSTWRNWCLRQTTQ